MFLQVVVAMTSTIFGSTVSYERAATFPEPHRRTELAGAETFLPADAIVG